MTFVASPLVYVMEKLQLCSVKSNAPAVPPIGKRPQRIGLREANTSHYLIGLVKATAFPKMRTLFISSFQ